MGWLHSCFSPLKKLWVRLRSAHKKILQFFILFPSISTAFIQWLTQRISEKSECKSIRTNATLQCQQLLAPEDESLSDTFSSRGIYILYEDVMSCPYEDVHVLWSILVESQTPGLPPNQ